MKVAGATRIPAAVMLGGAVTFVLFLLMQQLVTSDGGYRGELEPLRGIRFGPVEIPREIDARSRLKPLKPPPPENPPPPPRLQVSKIDPPAPVLSRMDVPRLDVPLVAGDGLFLAGFQQVEGNLEGDVVPVVVIRPMYPREAALAGTEGWVEVEFTITETGTVKDPLVVDSQPARLFNREAIRAILKWKFKPRVIDGVAVERRATQTINFTLEGQPAR
jgi:protein TonB